MEGVVGAFNDSLNRIESCVPITEHVRGFDHSLQLPIVFMDCGQKRDKNLFQIDYNLISFIDALSHRPFLFSCEQINHRL